MRCPFLALAVRPCLLAVAAVMLLVPRAHAQSGACCTVGTVGIGSCFISSAADCADFGGVFGGAGTTCNPAPCLGACCASGFSGFCILSDATRCLASNGLLFLGNGTTCTADPCTSLRGACCSVGLPGIGSCGIGFSAECERFGGTFGGPGSTCDPAPCLGACCASGFPDFCILSDATRCVASNGLLFLGNGTTCTADPCTPLRGACCSVGLPGIGSCGIGFSAECERFGGTFGGVGSTCDPAPCLGACCASGFSGFCILSDATRCIASNGLLFLGYGTACTADPCTPLRGACCSTGFTGAGSCVVIFSTECALSGGIFGGEGSTCDPAPCLGACCDPQGSVQCVLTTSAVCATIIGTYQGDGTVCSANPCAPIPLCRDATLDATESCIDLVVTAAQIDNGSHAVVPNCPVTLAIDPPGPYPVGDTTVTLTVTDCHDRSASCTATVTVLANDCDANLIPDICQCLWDSGPVASDPALIDGQISHLGGGLAGPAGGGARVADDFYLCPGRMHRIFDFQGFMLTDLIAPLRKARLELFEDCDGRPAGEPIRVFETTTAVELAGPTPDGLFLVRYDFDLCDINHSTGGPLWLEGGRVYWWSLVGLGSCTGLDLSAWAVAPGPVAGSTPVKSDGLSAAGNGAPCYPAAFEPWLPLDQCCIGCVKMAFSMRGSSCPIVWNNGPALPPGLAGSGGVLSENLSPTHRPRAADDFTAKPCSDLDLCLIDAWVWSNCNPVRGFVEIFRNDCREPGDLVATLINPIVIPTGETLVIDGAPRQGYILRFCDLDLTLPGGQTWWLSAGADRTGSQAARTYFARGRRCDQCPRHGLASQSSSPPASIRWNDVGPDLAFRIAAEPARPPLTASVITPAQSASCPGDFDRDGVTGVQDLFDFLAAFFSGCP